MKLQQALAQLVDIIVNNDTEKADVINILQLNEMGVDEDTEPSGYPHRIVLYGYGELYDIKEMKDTVFPKITAQQFIESNS